MDLRGYPVDQLLTPAGLTVLPARQGDGTGGSGTPTPPAREQPEGTGGSSKAKTPKQKLAELVPADRKAYLSFEYVQTKAGKKLEDQEAYRLLEEEGISEKGDAGELTDYDLPAYDTWTRQVRRARNALGGQKYQSRRNRPHG